MLFRNCLKTVKINHSLAKVPEKPLLFSVVEDKKQELANIKKLMLTLNGNCYKKYKFNK